MKKGLATGVVVWLISHWLHTAFLYSPNFAQDRTVSIGYSSGVTIIAFFVLIIIIFIDSIDS